MGQDTLSHDELGQVRERWLWTGVLVLALLLISCLALATMNSGPGWGSEDMKIRYYLVGIFTNIPDCLADLPCAPNPELTRNVHWVLVMDTEKQTPTGLEKQRQKILDISLPW